MKQPNVVLISIDTLRADHLSCYGYYRNTTPNLDLLGEDGVIYENAYSTAVWTPPAHASMLTGLYPSSHGTVDQNRLVEDIPTIAMVLSKSNYKTAGFVNNSQVGELVGFEKGHETFAELWKGTGGQSVLTRGAEYVARNIREFFGVNDHGAKRTNELVFQWLHDNKVEPFYLFIHYIEPHNPIDAPHPFKNKYRQARDHAKIDQKKVSLVANNPLICFTNNIVLNEEEIAMLKSMYDGEISYVDKKIAELLDYMKQKGFYDNTMIIVTADHGEHFGEHGLYSHVKSLYEPIVHIPLLIKYPKGTKKPDRVSELVQLVDIYPTVVEAAGLGNEFLEGVQGTSLFPGSGDTKYHDYVIAEWEGRIPSFINQRVKDLTASSIVEELSRKIVMIRTNDYKFIQNEDGEDELYNMHNDRAETNNLIKSHAEIAKNLKEELAKWQSTNRKAKMVTRSTMDEITRKNLEALGYL